MIIGRIESIGELLKKYGKDAKLKDILRESH